MRVRMNLCARTETNLCNAVQHCFQEVNLTVVFAQTNTFQAVLTTDGWLSFAMLNYGDLVWTTGILSGGDPHYGLGGTTALVNKHRPSITA